MLHTDGSVLPRARAGPRVVELPDGELRVRRPPGARSATTSSCCSGSTDDADYVVTLNAAGGRSTPAPVLATMTYAHPTYTRGSVAAQRELPTLNDGRTAFAGAWHGWGFHEDGCASGLRAAESFGAGW